MGVLGYVFLGRSPFVKVLHSKGTLLGTPNREPQEYSRNIIGIYLPGSPFLLYSWGSLFGVPIIAPPPSVWRCRGLQRLEA